VHGSGRHAHAGMFLHIFLVFHMSNFDLPCTRSMGSCMSSSALGLSERFCSVLYSQQRPARTKHVPRPAFASCDQELGRAAEHNTLAGAANSTGPAAATHTFSRISPFHTDISAAFLSIPAQRFCASCPKHGCLRAAEACLHAHGWGARAVHSGGAWRAGTHHLHICRRCVR